jgi:hypothetical protein
VALNESSYRLVHSNPTVQGSMCLSAGNGAGGLVLGGQSTCLLEVLQCRAEEEVGSRLDAPSLVESNTCLCKA